MANTVEFIIRARDEASAAIQRVSGATTDLRGALSSLVTGGGVFGIIAAGAVAATGAIVALGSAAAETVERLDRTAGRTGVTIEKLQAIQEVVEQGGGSFDSVVTALTFLNRSIATSDPLLKQLGITTRDTYSAFTQLAGVLSRSDDAAKRTEVAFKLMGRGAGEIIGQLGEIARNADAMEKELREAGALFEGGSANSARKLDTQLDELGQQWRSLVKSFQILATPLASLIVGMFDAMLKAAVGFAQAVRRDTVGALEELAKAAESQKTFAERLEEAKAEARKVGGSVQVGVPTVEGVEVKAKRPKDPLADLDLGATNAAVESRKRRLEELRSVLNVSRVDAERYLRVLEAVEAESKRDKLAKELIDAGVKPGDLPGAPLPGQENLRLGGVPSRETLQVSAPVPIDPNWQKQVDELLATAPKLSAEMLMVGMAWGQTVKEITSTTGIVMQGLEGLWSGLQNGFGQVFANLTSRTQTLRSAMKTIFSALVQEVLAMLARIVAAKVFGLILKLIPGIGTAAGFVVDAVGTKLTAGGGGSAAAALTAAEGAARNAEVAAQTQGRGNVTVNAPIMALDRAGIERALTDPRGTLRQAFAGASLAGAN